MVEDCPIGSELNLVTGTSAQIFDKIVMYYEDQQARERRLKSTKNAEKAAKVLERATKMSSGRAFNRDQVCLTEKKLLEHQLAWHEQKLKESREAAKRRRDASNRLKMKANKIRQKDEMDWNVSDYRTMLTYKKKAGDTAVSTVKDKDVLRAMWFERQSRQSPSNSDDEYEDFANTWYGTGLQEGVILKMEAKEGEDDVVDDGYI